MLQAFLHSLMETNSFLGGLSGIQLQEKEIEEKLVLYNRTVYSVNTQKLEQCGWIIKVLCYENCILHCEKLNTTTYI